MTLKRIKILIIFLALGQFLILSNAQAKEKYTASECFEGVSRATLKFNMTLDKAIFKPIAKGYRTLPVPVRLATGNAVDNLRSLLTLSNNLLQGDWDLAGNTAGRFAINSTVGILGFLDPAEKMGFEKEDEVIGLMMYLGDEEDLQLVEHLLVKSRSKCFEMKQIAEESSNAYYELSLIHI